MPLDPQRFLTDYPPAVRGRRWVPVEPAGFSGAGVWCGHDSTGPAFALKVIPGPSPAGRSRTIHRWMTAARAAGLRFVPAVVPTITGDTVAVTSDGVAEVIAWMPGAADFHTSPTPVRLTAAVTALAELHRVWYSVEHHAAPCPAVLRRLTLLAEWERFRPAFDRFDAESCDLLRTAVQWVNERLPASRRSLAAWSATPVDVFPCLCDVWHDHVLFTGDRVSAVIDYSAMKVDSPAVDLARLLADLVGNPSPCQGEGKRAERARVGVLPSTPSPRRGEGAKTPTELFAAGLRAYRDASPPSPVPDELVRVLADTGVVCGVANWVMRLSGQVTIPPVSCGATPPPPGNYVPTATPPQRGGVEASTDDDTPPPLPVGEGSPARAERGRRGWGGPNTPDCSIPERVQLRLRQLLHSAESG